MTPSPLRHLFTTALTLLLGLAACSASAGSVRVAVAANFTAAARELAAQFQQQSGHRALLSFGSTGKLYAQIVNGAPFEVFLSADQARPARTVSDGVAVAGSRFTYARGKLALFSADPTAIDAQGSILNQPERYRRLAIANPRLAPYGSAAVAALQQLGIYPQVHSKLVMGENIAQTYQFANSGNAELGIVALAQLVGRQQGSHWLIPAPLYPPIRQDAVLLKRGQANPAAHAFVAYLQSPAARQLIERHGYAVEPR